MKTYIEVESVQSGQPRAYSDSEYVSIVTFRRDDGRMKDWLEEKGLPLITPYYVTREMALKVARAFEDYQEEGDPGFCWASRQLVSFEAMDPTPSGERGPASQGRSDRWRIHVRAAFTD